MVFSSLRPARTLAVLLGFFVSVALLEAQPTVVPTADGQIGSAPLFGDRLMGTSFEPIRGQAGDILFSELRRQILIPATTEFNFLTDVIHGPSMPTEVASTPGVFNNVVELVPASARSRNAADTDDMVAFSSVRDGALANTMTIDVVTFDATGNVLNNMSIPNLLTFPDPAANQTGVAVDDQGRVTVAYTDISLGSGRVMAQRFDGLTGLPMGTATPITNLGQASTDVALLDPAGSRLIIPSSNFAAIRGNILDTSGPTPTVGPDFPVSTTPAIFANLFPVVGSDPQSGTSMVAWENLSGLQGDPQNIRARRFDAQGNPIGNDFRVNTTTANAQGQPAVAVGPNGLSVVAWAGDAAVAMDELDVFAQVYDANGMPIGGEIRVNTTTAEVQDRPSVGFMPEPDGQGRPQFTVVWRDVSTADGNMPNGTGTSYRCFSIDGISDPLNIFEDGFEAGDTSSWSATQP